MNFSKAHKETLEIGTEILEAVEGNCDEGTYLKVAALVKDLVNGTTRMAEISNNQEMILDINRVHNTLLRADAAGEIGKNRFAMIMEGLHPTEDGVFTRFTNNTSELVKEYRELFEILYDKKPPTDILKKLTRDGVECGKDEMLCVYACGRYNKKRISVLPVDKRALKFEY